MIFREGDTEHSRTGKGPVVLVAMLALAASGLLATAAAQADVQYYTFDAGGRKVSYPGNTCLPQKPAFLDAGGAIIPNYCFGPDVRAGTADDCGCPFGMRCNADGSCSRVCSDGTLPGQCSPERPVYCSMNGLLVMNATACGCPENAPIMLPDGSCSPEVRYTATAAKDFISGFGSSLGPVSVSFANLALGKAVTADSCANPGVLADGRSMIDRYTYNSSCTVSGSRPYYEINLVSNRSFNEVVIYFGYPYITDYTLEYNDGSVWRIFYRGRNSFGFITGWDGSIFSVQNEGRYRVGSISDGQFSMSDNGATGFIVDDSLKEGRRFILSEAFFDGSKYQSIQQRITLPAPISTQKIRLRPVQWQEGAKLYEIEVYNKDTRLILDSSTKPVYKDDTKAVYGQSFLASGVFESDAVFSGGSSSISYSNLGWSVGSAVVNSNITTSYDRGPRLFAKLTGGNYYVWSPTSGVVYTTAGAAPPWMAFFDGDYPINLSYKYYGLGGTPPYDSVTSGVYPGFGEVGYSKYCLSDGAWAGQNSPYTGKPCIMYPAETGYGLASPVSLSSQENITDEFGRVGEVINPRVSQFGSGVRGTALQFDGKSNIDYRNPNYIYFCGNKIKLGENHSFSFWFKTGYNGQQGLFGGWYAPESEKFEGISIHPSYASGLAPRVYYRQYYNDYGTHHASIDGVILNDSNWHHYVLMKNGSAVWIYRDGVFFGGGGINNINTVSLCRIGMAFCDGCTGRDESDPYARRLYTNGSLDEIRIYNRTLEPGEIATLYNLGSAPSLADRLLSYWTFDNVEYFNPQNETYAGSELTAIYYSTESGNRQSLNMEFDRIVLSELKNRIHQICISSGWNTIYCKGKSENESEYNVTTVFDIPGGISLSNFIVMLYTRRGVMPMIWEMALQDVQRGRATPVSAGSYNITMQFRTGATREEAIESPWFGADGVLNGNFTQPGQPIGSVHDGRPWFQYRVLASTPLANSSPLVDRIRVGFSGTSSLPPRAAVVPNESSVVQGSLMEFDSGQSFAMQGRLVSYEWEFSDGARWSGQTAKHAFAEAGRHYACLTVADSQGMEDRACADVDVGIFDCMTPDPSGSLNSEVISIADPAVQQAALDALREYADRRGISISDIEGAEEIYDVALEYLDRHMSYLPVNDRECAALGRDATLTQIIQNSGRCGGGCPEGAAFCGVCRDYSVAFTTLVRAMGVNSRCVYSAKTARSDVFSEVGHQYNIVNYRGKYRVIEPQNRNPYAKFQFASLDWTNDQSTPFYLTGIVFNDRFGDYRDSPPRPLPTIGASTNARVLNYMDSHGLPDPSRACDASTFTRLPDNHSEHRGRLAPWDPATLFTEVCP